jgi:hypothetical protein
VPGVDVHVHLAGLAGEGNGFLISPRLLKSPLFRFLIKQLGIDPARPQEANAIYVARLLEALRGSTTVDRCVLLALDRASGGDPARTHFYVPNDAVLELARLHPDRFLAGVSINPTRPDALDELARCAEAGAVLVKVLPNTQGFDPAEPAFIPFYRALARHGLPLLSHIGYEFSLIGEDQSLGEPRRLRRALDEGVTVIAAHGGGIGLPFSRRYFSDMLDLIRLYPRFYTDAAAVSFPNRRQTLKFFRDNPEVHPRILFGTDYPLPVFAWTALSRAARRAVAAETNPFDRQAALLKAHGIPFAFFDPDLAKHAGDR